MIRLSTNDQTINDTDKTEEGMHIIFNYENYLLWLNIATEPLYTADDLKKRYEDKKLEKTIISVRQI